MGFGYDRLRQLKPDIILGSVSGFGQYGPYRDRPAFDPLGQAMSGLMTLTGMPIGRPLGTASSIVDRYTSLHATIGMLAALHHRDRTGEGQVVDVCLMDFGVDHGRDPDLILPRHRPGGRRGRPAALPGQGRACRDLRIGARHGLKAVADRDWRSRCGRQYWRLYRADERSTIRREKRSRLGVSATPSTKSSPRLSRPTFRSPRSRPSRRSPKTRICGSVRCWSRWRTRLPARCTCPAPRSKCRKPPVVGRPTPGQHTDALLSGILGYDRATLDELRQAEGDRVSQRRVANGTRSATSRSQSKRPPDAWTRRLDPGRSLR